MKYYLGAMAEKAIPSLSREIESGKNPERHRFLKRQIIHMRTLRAEKSANFHQLQSIHFQYWQKGEGEGFFGKYPERFEKWFLGDHFVIVEELQKLTAQSGEFKHLYEVGCGDGRVVDYLSTHIPGLEDCTGLDINAKIIQENRETYARNPKLSFTSEDASKWLLENVEGGSIVMTYGGVYEYFSEQSLLDIFTTLKKGPKPVAVALVEPIDPAHDLTNEKHSRPFGAETSFSHNHRHLLESTGFEVLFDRDMLMYDRWKLLLAVAR